MNRRELLQRMPALAGGAIVAGCDTAAIVEHGGQVKAIIFAAREGVEDFDHVSIERINDQLKTALPGVIVAWVQGVDVHVIAEETDK